MAGINLYDAKTHLSELVDRAAAGEEIVITKRGRPMARLVAMASAAGDAPPRVPVDTMGITYVADDFDAPLTELEGVLAGGA